MTTNKTIEELALEKSRELHDNLYARMGPFFTASHYEEAVEIGFIAGAKAQKELSDAREAELIAVIEDCKTALEEVRDKAKSLTPYTSYAMDCISDEALTNINEKLEKLNGK